MSEPKAPIVLTQGFKRGCYFFGMVTIFIYSLYHLYWHFLFPIGMSLFLSFILYPVLEALEEKHIPKVISSSILLFITSLLFIFLCVVLFPYLYREVRQLAQMLPDTINIFFEKWVPSIEEFLLTNKLADKEGVGKLIKSLKDFSMLSRQAVPAIQTALNTLPQVLSVFINIAFIPVITFVVLNNSGRAGKFLVTLIPTDLKEPTLNCLRQMNQTIRSLLAGQVLIAMIMAVLYPIGFLIIDFPSAVSIGLLIGMARVIPYLDLIVGISLCTVVVFSDFTGWMDFVPVTIVFVIIASFDGMIVTPRILGKSQDFIH